MTGRRIVVLAGPGDRRDEDLVAIAKAVAGRFDHYICRRDDNLRNRAAGRSAAHSGAGAARGGRARDAISIIPDEQEAIEAALRMGEPGDLLLIFADALARSWKQITKFKASDRCRRDTPRATPRATAVRRQQRHREPRARPRAPTPHRLRIQSRRPDSRRARVRLAPESDD